MVAVRPSPTQSRSRRIEVQIERPFYVFGSAGRLEIDERAHSLSRFLARQDVDIEPRRCGRHRRRARLQTLEVLEVRTPHRFQYSVVACAALVQKDLLMARRQQRRNRVALERQHEVRARCMVGYAKGSVAVGAEEAAGGEKLQDSVIFHESIDFGSVQADFQVCALDRLGDGAELGQLCSPPHRQRRIAQKLRVHGCARQRENRCCGCRADRRRQLSTEVAHAAQRGGEQAKWNADMDDALEVDDERYAVALVVRREQRPAETGEDQGGWRRPRAFEGREPQKGA